MANTISLNQRFTLTFKMKKGQLKSCEQLLTKNGFIHQTWVQMAFENIIEFRVEVNIRQAEVIRCLIKNFNIYE
jgi:hypothetical protein